MISGRIRNYICYTVISLVFFGLIIGLLEAYSKNAETRKDYNNYQKVLALISENKYADAFPIIDGLMKKYGDDVVIKWKYAMCLAVLGKNEEAIKVYIEIQNRRPTVLGDQLYLLQFGEVLYVSGKEDLAKGYLAAAVKNNADSTMTQTAQLVLDKISFPKDSALTKE